MIGDTFYESIIAETFGSIKKAAEYAMKNGGYAATAREIEKRTGIKINPSTFRIIIRRHGYNAAVGEKPEPKCVRYIREYGTDMSIADIVSRITGDSRRNIRAKHKKLYANLQYARKWVKARHGDAA